MTIHQLRRAFYCSGCLILLIGLGTATWIWRAQDLIDLKNADTQTSALDDRRYVREVEIYSGKAGVMMEQAKEMMHGKPLAKTIAVVSIVTAAGIFLVAARFQEE